MDDQPAVSGPLFHILLSLADEPRHGYGIIQEVEVRTGGRVVLGAGTLYSAIRRIREWGWIEEIDAPEDGDRRRRYYRLTEDGRDVVRSEAGRLQSLVRQARDKNVLDTAAESAG
jgi:DNA-binding PadR family transcriptional regulator